MRLIYPFNPWPQCGTIDSSRSSDNTAALKESVNVKTKEKRSQTVTFIYFTKPDSLIKLLVILNPTVNEHEHSTPSVS